MNKGRTASDIVYSELRALILDGEFPPNHPLRGEELATRFGTSRIPVREALKHLESEGLVTHHPFKGVVVASLSLTEMLEIYDIRIALECRALALSVPNFSKAELREVNQILQRAEQSVNGKELALTNREFHLKICSACDRPRLMKMIESSLDLSERFIRIDTYHVDETLKEHWDIYAACCERDVGLSVRLLEDHLNDARNTLSAGLRSRLSVGGTGGTNAVVRGDE